MKDLRAVCVVFHVALNVKQIVRIRYALSGASIPMAPMTNLGPVSHCSDLLAVEILVYIR